MSIGLDYHSMLYHDIKSGDLESLKDLIADQAYVLTTFVSKGRTTESERKPLRFKGAASASGQG